MSLPNASVKKFLSVIDEVNNGGSYRSPLAGKRKDYKYKIFLVNNKEETFLPSFSKHEELKIDNIKDFLALLQISDFFLGVDHPYLQAVGISGKNAITMFGPTKPGSRIAQFKNLIPLINDQIPCLGCGDKACHQNSFCLSSISPETMLALIEKYIEYTIV
jgi:ADP-heptose:LPS heptosyltransferase